MSGPRVLISGGGIAGPALAHLLRAYGFRPTIVERAPEVRAGGHGIQIDGVGIDALRRIGVLDEARRAGGPTPDEIHLDYGGHRLVMPNGAPRLSDETGLMIRRGDLAELLYRHVRDDVEYLFDDTVTGLRETEEGILVDFENRPSRDFDLVVGADGVHSGVRSLVFGPEERFLHYKGTNIALFDIENHLGPVRHMIGRARARRGTLLQPTPDTELLECFLLTRDPEPLTDVEGHRALLRKRFERDGEETRRLLEAMEHARTTYTTPSAQVRMDSWSLGRTVLLGDAGHALEPMTTQGGSLALTGACVLGGELAKARGDHRVAFPAYERAMRGLVDANILTSQANGEIFVPSSGAIGTYVRSWLLDGASRLGQRMRPSAEQRKAYNLPLDEHLPAGAGA